jgi:hypothetical protein
VLTAESAGSWDLENATVAVSAVGCVASTESPDFSLSTGGGQKLGQSAFGALKALSTEGMLFSGLHPGRPLLLSCRPCGRLYAQSERRNDVS